MGLVEPFIKRHVELLETAVRLAVRETRALIDAPGGRIEIENARFYPLP